MPLFAVPLPLSVIGKVGVLLISKCLPEAAVNVNVERLIVSPGVAVLVCDAGLYVQSPFDEFN